MKAQVSKVTEFSPFEMVYHTEPPVWYILGILVPKRFHINRLKQYYLNLEEIGENGQLNIVQNVNELYDIRNDLKEGV